jgi:hypothetical protein
VDNDASPQGAPFPDAAAGPGAEAGPRVTRIIFWLLLLYSLGLALMVLEDVLFHTYV